MCVARGVPAWAEFPVYADRRGEYRGLEEEAPMSLVFALLREDHIIFASDSRHVMGTPDGKYLNDKCCKIERALNDSALLGFAGDDICESIVVTLRRNNSLNGQKSLDALALEVSKTAAGLYKKKFPDETNHPNAEFLLAGFDEKGAITYRIEAPHFGISVRMFDDSLNYDTFEVIGKRRHGALYFFRKCATQALTVELGIRLACFGLKEVEVYDTTVGGPPQIYVIFPGKIEDRSAQLHAHMKWAGSVGDRIRTLILSPRNTELTPSQSKRGRPPSQA